MKFAEVRFRDCGECGTRNVAMEVEWSKSDIQKADGDLRSWAALSCPRCGGITTVELLLPRSMSSTIAPSTEAVVVRTFPEGVDGTYKVAHLPENVSRYLETSVRVLQAGVPDAAAVQLRRTLEAAAAAKGVNDPNKPLVKSIEKLIDQGFVTKEFAEALSHVRKVGNQGAHFTDNPLSKEDVTRALLFTVQFLRNLFEVPGELAIINESEAEDSQPEDA